MMRVYWRIQGAGGGVASGGAGAGGPYRVGQSWGVGDKMLNRLLPSVYGVNSKSIACNALRFSGTATERKNTPVFWRREGAGWGSVQMSRDALAAGVTGRERRTADPARPSFPHVRVGKRWTRDAPHAGGGAGSPSAKTEPPFLTRRTSAFALRA